jgi:DNA (cytosine-5)-methyltransferase 1
VLSHNSMHHGVAQSRDRIYVVWWRAGLDPDLELELDRLVPALRRRRVVRQAWKNGRTVGRYRQQWVWACTTCGADVRTVDRAGRVDHRLVARLPAHR